MAAVRLGQLILIAFAAASAIVFATPDAFAQTSVKAVFEKYNLIGTFAWDCNLPASKENLYYMNRLLDDGAVERDQMSGPTTRDYVVFIDQASATAPNQIAVSGTLDGKPVSGVWRLQEQESVRVGDREVAGKILSITEPQRNRL